MDNSHVALVAMQLKTDAFSPYRCDRNIALGINLASLQKVLRAAQNDDLLTLKADDAPDVLNLIFENSENDRISEYDIKLMDIDQEHLGIPDTEYAATVTMPSAEFQRICRDLSLLSESGGCILRRGCCVRLLTERQFQLRLPRKGLNSLARATSEAELSHCGQATTSRSRNCPPPLSFRNRYL